jgi:hypothetical protein
LVVDLESVDPKFELGSQDWIGWTNLLDAAAEFANDDDAGE